MQSHQELVKSKIIQYESLQNNLPPLHNELHWISWNLRMALPGISDWHNFCITTGASSAENSVWGGGIIYKKKPTMKSWKRSWSWKFTSPEATFCTSCCSCSTVPFDTASIFCCLSEAKRENFGNKRSATSSLTKTTPFAFKHCKDLCKDLEVVPKSITISTRPLQASFVRSISCFS